MDNPSDADAIRDADLLLLDYHLITMQPTGVPYGLIADGGIAIDDGTICWVGRAADAADLTRDGPQVIRGSGQFISPGLIDCHTHLVWGGSRADEWQQRLLGDSYEAIAARGGGILSTVRHTRDATGDELYAAARSRIEHLMRQGVTSLEIKSGYGLNTETELKMLQVATDLRDSMPLDIARTFLGAHAVPPEFTGRSDDYVAYVCNEMIPQAAAWCEAADVFCEKIAFDVDQSRRVLEAAQAAGLNLRIHAEQLSHLGGAAMAARLGARTADHLEYLDRAGAESLAEQGTVAVLLPGAFYFIHETQIPPVDLFRRLEIPVAVATDANPGSSPVASLLLMMNMACTLFRLTPEEALAGVTCQAARALGWESRLGTLAVGRQADLVIWNIQSPAELAYGIGHNPCQAVYKKGELIVDHR